MNKDIEFNKELLKLQETLTILNTEMLEYISKRKYITEYIIEYRKKVMEENKFDEDQVVEYFDHEAYVKEQAYLAIDKRLKEISILKESPYFGKITFTEDDDAPNEIYIGRFGAFKSNGYEPMIIDWRAPVASLFYKGSLGEASYITPEGEMEAQILSRSQLIIKKGELKGIFDSALNVKDEILQMVLSQNTSNTHLKDIIMTIQKEQDDIIRQLKDDIVVVDGVAGSGKTTIALHRVSYLLYNFRKKFQDKILILGPNDIFIDYISEVLPSLGESNVREQTFESFAMNEIGIDYEIKGPGYYVEESLKKNNVVIDEYKYKNSIEYINKLDDIVKCLNKDYFKIHPIIFFGEEIVSIDEIKELFTKFYSDMPLFRRSEKIKRILTSKIKDKRDEYIRKLNLEIKQLTESLSNEELEIQKNDIDFRRKIRIREIVREVMNSRERLDEWIITPDIIELYKRLTKTHNIGYVDLAPILYLMIKLQGKKSSKEIKHIVIDEAQDYSMIQFTVLKELTKCQSFTIVGDKNQRFIKSSDIPDMLKLQSLFDQSNIAEFKLLKSYRSTKQIMDYASSFLDDKKEVPLVRKGENVLEDRVSNSEDLCKTLNSLIEDYEEDNLDSIAIIVKDNDILERVSNIIKGKIKVLTFNREDIIYNGGRVLVPSYYAKGLEFDGVIIIEEAKSKTDSLIKYIMCTRALHRLSIISLDY